MKRVYINTAKLEDVANPMNIHCKEKTSFSERILTIFQALYKTNYYNKQSVILTEHEIESIIEELATYQYNITDIEYFILIGYFYKKLNQLRKKPDIYLHITYDYNFKIKAIKALREWFKTIQFQANNSNHTIDLKFCKYATEANLLYGPYNKEFVDFTVNFFSEWLGVVKIRFTTKSDVNQIESYQSFFKKYNEGLI